jgi:phospholipid-binding lipoprotein MlaA
MINYIWKKYMKFLFVLIIILMSVNCHALPENANDQDPYQSFNRVMFNINEHLDEYIFKPVATLYNKIMPKPLNKGIHNAFRNLDSVATICNDLLQVNFYQATSDLWRLAINSTLGIGGLFDVAERMQLKPNTNDFGLTLAYWGYVNSTYLVLPFWGPRTVRDTLSIPVDYYGFSLYPYIEPRDLRWGLYGLSVVDIRAQLLHYQPVMEEAALDKYAFIRNAYLQRRQYQIQQIRGQQPAHNEAKRASDVL